MCCVHVMTGWIGMRDSCHSSTNYCLIEKKQWCKGQFYGVHTICISVEACWASHSRILKWFQFSSFILVLRWKFTPRSQWHLVCHGLIGYCLGQLDVGSCSPCMIHIYHSWPLLLWSNTKLYQLYIHPQTNLASAISSLSRRWYKKSHETCIWGDWITLILYIGLLIAESWFESSLWLDYSVLVISIILTSALPLGISLIWSGVKYSSLSILFILWFADD